MPVGNINDYVSPFGYERKGKHIGIFYVKQNGYGEPKCR
jgi:hypothetical protein